MADSSIILHNIIVRYLLPIFIIFSIFITSCGTTSRFGKSNANKGNKPNATGKVIEDGIASWYGPNFHGQLTANGEEYDMNKLTAAHRTLPFNTILKVKNLDNSQSVQVRVNDRGPYAKNRIIDLSKKAAEEIEMLGPGTARVELVLLEGNLENSRITNLKVPTYTVQLDSFSDKDKAYTHSRKIKNSRVEKINLENKIVYRVYYGIYSDKNEARQKRNELKQKGFNGYVKQIQN